MVIFAHFFISISISCQTHSFKQYFQNLEPENPGIPLIPVYRLYRYTVYIGIPFISVYRLYWYTVYIGIPLKPLVDFPVYHF